MHYNDSIDPLLIKGFFLYIVGMRNIILTSIALLSFTFSYAQYSDYSITGDIDVSSNINVSGDIDVNVEKTIKTIDYGALAQANAIREQW